MTTALLMIDVQQSFRRRPYWSENDLPAFMAQTAALIGGCVRQGIPIVRVFHTDGQPVADNPFSHESGLIRPLDGLVDFAPALTVEKHRHSALVGTTLPVWLHRKGIRRLIVAGIRTEQCCETTARLAADLGFDVTFVMDATATTPIPHRDFPAGRSVAEILADPRTLGTADIIARTEYALAGRFATIASVADLVPQGGPAAVAAAR
jgi:nicotinamidase-related amidase